VDLYSFHLLQSVVDGLNMLCNKLIVERVVINQEQIETVELEPAQTVSVSLPALSVYVSK